MALYFLLGTLTHEGQRLLHQNPDLAVQTAREVQVNGAEILGQYAVLGRYDFVMMVQAEGNDAVARMSQEIGRRTGLHIETLTAIAVGFLADRSPINPEGEIAVVELPTAGPSADP